jgi:hypothetical protein
MCSTRIGNTYEGIEAALFTLMFKITAEMQSNYCFIRSKRFIKDGSFLLGMEDGANLMFTVCFS